MTFQGQGLRWHLKVVQTFMRILATCASYYSWVNKGTLLFLVNRGLEIQTKVAAIQIKHPVYPAENPLRHARFLKAKATYRLKGLFGSEYIFIRYHRLMNGIKLKNTCGFKLFVYIPLNLTESKNLTGRIIAGINLCSTDCSDLYQLEICLTLLNRQGEHSVFAWLL